MRSGLRLLLLSTLVVLVSACASNKQEEVLPEKTYYENAREAMTSGNFNEAEQNLDALETYYPFGRYAEQAQLDLIYARYQNLDLEGSRAAADRFLRLNPQSDHADYALYMRGLASYNLDIGLAARYFPIDVAARDPGEQLQSFRDFSELLNRYPDSQYVADARQRMIAVRNRMAELEHPAQRDLRWALAMRAADGGDGRRALGLAPCRGDHARPRLRERLRDAREERGAAARELARPKAWPFHASEPPTSSPLGS